jgi:hypothetical protein
MNADRFKALKVEVEEDRAASLRAQGALDQLMKRLKDEFKCTTLEQARNLLEQLRYGCNRMEKKFNRELDAYERKWKRETGETHREANSEE